MKKRPEKTEEKNMETERIENVGELTIHALKIVYVCLPYTFYTLIMNTHIIFCCIFNVIDR